MLQLSFFKGGEYCSFCISYKMLPLLFENILSLRNSLKSTEKHRLFAEIYGDDENREVIRTLVDIQVGVTTLQKNIKKKKRTL